MSLHRLRKGSRMDTVTDIAVQGCFVVLVVVNRLRTAHSSWSCTPLPDTSRASLHRYRLARLAPQFRRKRYGRFPPESVVLQAYQQMLASQRQHEQVGATDFLNA